MNTTEHGSAKWLDKYDVQKRGLIDAGGITLGHMWSDRWGSIEPAIDPVTYNGEAHLLTIAKNRSGKGTSAIVPNLLTYQGGVFCIDPKGENAIVTAASRRSRGQDVHIIDPWGIALKRLEGECGFNGSDDYSTPSRPENSAPFPCSTFNPLDMIPADSPDLTDDAMMVAEAHIMESGGDSHWSTEAKAALAGFVMHVITSPNEDGQRHLPRVRDVISLPPQEIGAIIKDDMAKSHHPAVRNAANRLMQKTEKELASVMSTVSANTHFLDSPAIRQTLTSSSFDFAALKDDENPLTVYLVLPAERLNTHGRWLRLLVSMALTSVSRRVGKPRKSALFILDEFAALGHLQKVEEAFGLMAGFGMRIWAILQDLNQLQDLYKSRWQTFIANAGAVQIFGISDSMTADYFSRYMGRQTIEQISQATAAIREGGVFFAADPSYRSMNDRTLGRDLVTSDELMKMSERRAILLISPNDPIVVGKIAYFDEWRFYNPQEKSLAYTPHPDFGEPKLNNLHASGKAGRAMRDLATGQTAKTKTPWRWAGWKIAALLLIAVVFIWQLNECWFYNPRVAQCYVKAMENHRLW